jgi:hypothetical protein
MSTPLQVPALVGFKYDSVDDAALASDMQTAANRIRDRTKSRSKKKGFMLNGLVGLSGAA